MPKGNRILQETKTETRKRLLQVIEITLQQRQVTQQEEMANE